MIRALPLLALAACAGPTAAPESWRLETLNGAPIEGSATLTLGPGGEISGQAPCNLYRTRNTVAEPALALAPINSTRRACIIEGGEAAFLAALSRATRIERGARLTLSGPGGTLVFAPDPLVSGPPRR